MLVNAKTKGLGLIGNPVSHSFSPVIHNAISESLGLNYNYMAYKVETDGVENALMGMSSLGFRGTNVTVPHKTNVIPYLSEIRKEAKIIGAVNTILFDNNRLIGYNTDCYGFSKMLEDEDVSLTNLKVLILGAGGAARAVVAACIMAESSQVHICSRTIEKSNAYIKEFEENAPNAMKWNALTYDKLTDLGLEYDLVVNCTPLGMHPNEGKTPVNPSIFKKECVLVDLIYNPKNTEFLTQGNELGMKTINGLGMLIHQALEAYRIWTGQTQSAEFVKSALSENGFI